MHFSAGQLNTIKDLQTTYNWLVSFSGPTSAPLASEDLHLRCQTSDLPKRTHELQNVELHGHTINRPGKVTQAGELNLQFIEDVDAVVAKAFRELEDKTWTVDSVGDSKGNREDFGALQFTMTMMLLDHKEQPTQTFTLHECQLKEFDAGGALNSENDFFKPTAQIAYNYFTWKKN